MDTHDMEQQESLMKLHLSFLLAVALGSLAGCTQSKVVIGDDDAGPDPVDGGGALDSTADSGDDAGPTVDGGGPRTCGGVTCESSAACCTGCEGESICSASDGICPAIVCPPCGEDVCESGETCCTDCDGGAFCGPGGCPPIACDPCTAQDARSGADTCALLIGYAWNGSGCDAILCSCEGSDCDELYDTEGACSSEHSSCTPTTCSNDAECDLDEWCNPCAHGSCPECADCVQDCAPHGCATGREVACRQLRPDCGESGVAVVSEELCWECVDRETCEPLPEDCRTTGCVGIDSPTCRGCMEPDRTVWVCLPEGDVC